MDRKIVYIMRGPSGSGKSTEAWKIRHREEVENKKRVVVCSTDDYFTTIIMGFLGDVVVSYKFDASQLGAAHLSCKTRFEQAILDGVSVIIVDNTNTTAKEVGHYATIAFDSNYEVEIVETPRTGWVAEQLAARNVHGVPLEVIERQIRNCLVPIDVREFDRRTLPGMKESMVRMRVAAEESLSTVAKLQEDLAKRKMSRSLAGKEACS